MEEMCVDSLKVRCCGLEESISNIDISGSL
jgi:hypothetical protein